ncbi:Metallo-dependent hydrolase [Trichocladium antarcticum]|uniref:Metallo-dependent hydrolase n=1 Tax=Trichocladium antarcticum TaxID=1450529 RepID=A0AAN6ZA78_9PEZI|nr:Metallo-dependent hydrolase [Trichocladium antarcticum]
MCRPSDSHAVAAGVPRDGSGADDFPWHVGACDAHCHPTDTMSSIASIRDMRARALTVMATRGQDQDLVASVAGKHGIADGAALDAPAGPASGKIVPAFGWHPWFSYQLYDDTADAGDSTYDPAAPAAAAQKAKHYGAVLSPAPDADFIAASPDPLPLSAFIAETRRRVLDAGTALIGEVGVDKAFRLPWPWNPAEHSGRDGGLTPGGREGRTLSPYHVKMPHQVQILKAQLRLAGELGVAVSVHGVQAHGVLFDALASLWKGHEKEVVSRRKQKMVAAGAEDFSSSDEDDGCGEADGAGGVAPRPYKPKPFPPRVCLHSFSGSPQMLSQYLNPAIPARVFFSFSTAVNLSTAGGESKFPGVIRACPDDQLLVESDLHTAGAEMDHALEDMYRKVCGAKGWALEDGMERIRRNYGRFIFG